MNKLYNEFFKMLELEDKEGCVALILRELKEKRIKIKELYEEILAPALNNFECHNDEQKLCIWKEHIRSSIIRTIIENCYSFVIEEKKLKDLNKNEEIVAVVCPEGELHELGARMISDIFCINGYKTFFIGGNTPQNQFISFIEHLKPKIVSISVSNYYNLVATKKITNTIKELALKDVIIVVGGSAFKNNKINIKEIGAHFLIEKFDDIEHLNGGE